MIVIYDLYENRLWRVVDIIGNSICEIESQDKLVRWALFKELTQYNPYEEEI